MPSESMFAQSTLSPDVCDTRYAGFESTQCPGGDGVAAAGAGGGVTAGGGGGGPSTQVTGHTPPPLGVQPQVIWHISFTRTPA